MRQLIVLKVHAGMWMCLIKRWVACHHIEQYYTTGEEIDRVARIGPMKDQLWSLVPFSSAPIREQPGPIRSLDSSCKAKICNFEIELLI